MKKERVKRYEVICFDGFGVWHISNCGSRAVARQEKKFHMSLFEAFKPSEKHLSFKSQYPYVRIWDRSLHSWV